MPSYRLTLAYDGTDFAGSQVQPGQRTVQGALERALGDHLGASTRTKFAGRTDRGVHAVGQVAAVHLPTWRGGAGALQRALLAGLPGDLAALDVRDCDESFNPRFDAVWREYRYWIAPGAVSPFLGRYAWTPRSDLVVDAMNVAAWRLVGTHDFASFAGGGEGVPWSERALRPRGTTRTIIRCACRETVVCSGPGADQAQRLVEIAVAADGFLPRMVRNIVGALAQIGQGRQDPEWIATVLDSRDRRNAPGVAPARGLTLRAVGFGVDSPADW